MYVKIVYIMRDVYLKSIKIIKNTINYVKILVVYTVKM